MYEQQAVNEAMGQFIQQPINKIIEKKLPKVGDVYRLIKKDGKYRLWKITGVFIGALNQESYISMQTIDKDPGLDSLFIPCDLFDCVLNFERV